MTGAEQQKRWPEAETVPAAAPDEVVETEVPHGRRVWPRLFAIAAVLLALAWMASLAFFVASASPPGGPGPLRIAAWIGLGSGPLALLAALSILVLRMGTSEATAYARAAAQLRNESRTLAEMLGILTRRIESARAGLAEQGSMLATLGEEAGERLQRAGETLRQHTAQVAATAATLDDSAASARTDLGVLIADLPQAESLAAALGDRLRALGADSHEQTEALLHRIAALEAAARGADQTSVGAARRLAAELDRVESNVAAVDRRIAETTGRIERASADALEGSADALERVRRGIDAQGAALSALIAQAHAAIESGGGEAHAALGTRAEALARTSETIAAELRAHDAAAAQMVERIGHALQAIEARFATLGERGAERTAGLDEVIRSLAEQAGELDRLLGEGNTAAEALTGRAETIRGHVEAVHGTLEAAIPAALSHVREQAEHGLGPIGDALPQAERLASIAGEIGDRLGAVDAMLSNQRESLGALHQSSVSRLADLTAQANALHDLLARTDADLRGIADGASVQLVDALLRVRDTAAQAGERAREALASAIPDAARQLGEHSAEAMRQALHDVGEGQVAALGEASARAVEAAQAASDRLARQLATIAETSARIEAQTSTDDQQGFVRQMGLLIEALNSGAIDIAKIFSNEPTDTAWAAYLKGDRGVFTRRAVHLLEAGEARAIAARYGDDPEFRDQVNRYVHDFETMLRRVLAVREGGPMGVTLLSSDAGKLYVLLAQAIERLRR